MGGDLGQEVTSNTAIVMEGGTRALPRLPEGAQWVGRADFRAPLFSPPLLPAERAQALPEVTLANLRNWDRASLIRALIAKMQADPSWVPSPEEAETLVCIYVRDFYQSRGGGHLSEKALPWPTDAIKTSEKITDKIGYAKTEKGRVVSTAFGQLLDEMDGRFGANALHTVLQKAFTRMPQSDVARLGTYLLNHLDTFYEYTLGNERELTELFDLIFDHVDTYGMAGLTFGRDIISFFEKIGEKSVITSIVPTLKHPDYDYLKQLATGKRPILMYRALATGDYDIATRDKMIGLLTRRAGLPRQLNLLRSMVDNEYLPTLERENIVNLLRNLLTLSMSLPVHTKLDEVYQTIQFENYQVNERTKAPRLASLTAIFKRYGINTEARILDLASGTGWLTGSLRQEGYTQVHGIDASERNVAVAQKTYGPHFARGDWLKLPLQSGSQDVVLCLGRSLPHTEEAFKFEAVLAEIERITKVGGIVIFDMPDPTKGDYLEHVRSYREAMRHFGYSNYELKDFWYIIDSPDGINFYNRFVPPRKWIDEELWVQNFDRLDVHKEEIPNGKGDVNLVFVYRKLAGSRVIRKSAGTDETYS